MRLERLIARGFRNLENLDRELPAAGLALLGPNGQGKTNLLEALYYPVLFRSLYASYQAIFAVWQDDAAPAQAGGSLA